MPEIPNYREFSTFKDFVALMDEFQLWAVPLNLVLFSGVGGIIEGFPYFTIYSLKESKYEIGIQFLDNDVAPIDMGERDSLFHYHFDDLKISGRLYRPDKGVSTINLIDTSEKRMSFNIMFTHEEIPE